MPLNIEAKKEVVKELNSEANNSVAGAIAEFSGLNVKDLTLLRTRARESDIYLKVVKNSLSRRAFAETNFECLVDDLNGPIIIALSKEDLASPARLFKDFGKDYEQLRTIGLSINGAAYPASDLERIAKLPTKDEAYSCLLYTSPSPRD